MTILIAYLALCFLAVIARMYVLLRRELRLRRGVRQRSRRPVKQRTAEILPFRGGKHA